jgi:repressor LexA
MGPKIRKQRRRLGLTLDELSGRTGISKPYLSLIETGRTSNPPSDEKIRRLEQTLGFTAGELLIEAHLQRTPRDVRAVFVKLLANGSTLETGTPNSSGEDADQEVQTAVLSDAVRGFLDESSGKLEKVMGNAVPVINGASGGYPRDFADLSYPSRVAEQHVTCPDLADEQAFAARVSGESMTPKYRQGDIVIFSPALTPRSGDDCFVRFADGQTTFQRVFFESDEQSRVPMIRLQPRNERHRPTILPCDRVAGLYRAVYRYHRVDEE